MSSDPDVDNFCVIIISQHPLPALLHRSEFMEVSNTSTGKYAPGAYHKSVTGGGVEGFDDKD